MLVEGLTLAEMFEDPTLRPRVLATSAKPANPSTSAAFMEAMGLDPDDEIEEQGVEFLLNAVGAKKNRMVWT